MYEYQLRLSNFKGTIPLLGKILIRFLAESCMRQITPLINSQRLETASLRQSKGRQHSLYTC